MLAACPEATARAATPPSKAASRFSSTGGVHETGVDVARLAQGEEVGGMRGVVELVAGRLIDRHCDCCRGWVSAIASMKDNSFRMT